MGGIDLRINRTMHRAAIGNAGVLDAPEDGVEPFLVDPEAVMNARDGLAPGIEIDVRPSLTYTGANGPMPVSDQGTPSSSASNRADPTRSRAGTMTWSSSIAMPNLRSGQAFTIAQTPFP